MSRDRALPVGSRQRVEDWFLARIARLSNPPRPVQDVAGDSNLSVDLEIDSLAFIELLIGFEEEFDVQLSEEHLLLEQYHDVSSLIDHVSHLLETPPRD